MKLILRKVLEYTLVMLIMVGTVWAVNKNRFSNYLTLATRSLVDVFMEYETTGVLNLTTTLTGIGTLRPTGVTKTLVISTIPDSSVVVAQAPGSFFTQWIASADTDNGIRLMGDAILDSISVFATPTTTDSLIIITYNTDANPPVTISTDTLIYSAAGYKSKSYTSITDATRDFNVSAGQYPAFRVTEVGTLSTVVFTMHFREYDVQ